MGSKQETETAGIGDIVKDTEQASVNSADGATAVVLLTTIAVLSVHVTKLEKLILDLYARVAVLEGKPLNS